MSNQTQVIVIGAGIAGLSAAQALRENGYSVVILEGRARIGGRVWTNRDWPSAPLELGARWIQGIKKNPVTKIAGQINASLMETDYDNAWLYDGDGQLLDDNVWNYMEKLGKKLIREAVRTQRKRGTADCSLQAALIDSEPYQRLSEYDRRCFNFYVNTYIEHELSADIGELSALNMDDAEEFKGDDVIFLAGYDQIATHLAQGLDIHLEHRVEKVDYQQEQGVTLLTNQGVFQADYAIVTLPLGVLKRGQVQFVPPLPGEKQAAIDMLGVGILNPTHLRFPRAFWPKEAELLNYMPLEKGHWAEWFNLYHYTDQPILVGYNAGSYGHALEKKSDQDVIGEAMRVLRLMYGTAVPDPEAWHIARWGMDPFAGGSYSFNAVGTSRTTRKQFAEPVQGRLFFAGEATSVDYPATVHGAHLSGQREAARIMTLPTVST
jgi:monoamine oxidase